MPTWLQTITNMQITLPIALAVIGGLVRILHKGEECTLGRVFGSLITAGFVGAITFLFIFEFKIPDGMKVAVTGLSGYAGGTMLPMAEKWLVNKSPLSKGDDL